jgi:hypothetical protein
MNMFHDRAQVRHLHHSSEDPPGIVGNVVLKDGQDRTLTGRQTLHLIWVDQEEQWYEV